MDRISFAFYAIPEFCHGSNRNTPLKYHRPVCMRRDVSKQNKSRGGWPAKGSELEQRQQNRERRGIRRSAITATWGGVTLARTAEYEFLDGRFYFPKTSVASKYLEENGKMKHQNPVGTAKVCDIVVRDKNGRIVKRNRGAAWYFDDLRRVWKILEGYTSFWKGVKIQAAEENDYARDNDERGLSQRFAESGSS